MRNHLATSLCPPLQKRFWSFAKRRASIFASAAAVALLAAVGAGAQEPLVTKERIGRADAPNVLTFRNQAIQTNSHPVPAFADKMTALYEAYAKNHPDWQVEIEIQSTQLPQEMASMLTKAMAGNAADCQLVDTQYIQLFIKQGVLQPINEYFSKEEIAELFPFILPIVSDDKGNIYGWWWTTDLRIIYRNTDLVPKAPETWAEMQAAALAAKEKAGSGVDGIIFNGGRGETTMIDFLAYIRAAGGEVIDETGKPIFGEEPNRTAILKALAHYKALVDSGAAPAMVASLVSYDEQTAAAVAGTTAMIQSVDSRYAQMRTAMKPDQFSKWAASLLPGETADRRSTATGGGAFAVFTKDPAKAKACMDLVREVYMGQANEALARIPTRAGLFDAGFFNTPFYAQMREFLKVGKPRPGAAIYPDVSNELQAAIGDVLTGAVAAEVAVDRAFENVKKAYDRQQGR